MPATYDVLILGASYGSLLATKLSLAGHNVKLVCLPAEAELINREGAIVRMPVKGREPVEIDSRKLPGKLSAAGPGAVDPADYDLVVLAMQEPQYRSPGVRELLDAVAKAQGAVHVDHEHAAAAVPRAHSRASTSTRCSGCYTDPTVWDSFDPALMTLCSPDPQAFRPPEEKVNVLQVRLPTNFKVGALRRRTRTPRCCASSRPTSRRRASTPATADRTAGEAQGARLGLRAARQVGDADRRQLPLRARRTACARSRKRCTATSTTSRARLRLGGRAVRRRSAPPTTTWCRSRSTPPPRRRSRSPSSAARALFAGAPNIERVDRLVQTIAAQKGLRNPVVDETVALVDDWLAAIRKAAA